MHIFSSKASIVSPFILPNDIDIVSGFYLMGRKSK